MSDVGTAYGRKQAHYDTALTEVGPGTPMGEYLRRYWHPIGVLEDATDLPRQVRVLGEDLILFRDGQGRPGLVYPRCMHRGTSLLYGRVERDGIRCCYHGWKFDVEGHCLDQPLEPNGGAFRHKVRQPWYPVQELYGLIFAYMGSPEKKPVLPRYDCLERFETLHADGELSVGSMNQDAVVPFNWFQHYENIHDMGHAFWLHQFHSGPQFGEAFNGISQAALPAITGGVEYERSSRGVLSRTIAPRPDGSTLTMVIETILPTLRVVAGPRPGKVDHIGWVLPIDDTHFRIFTVSGDPVVYENTRRMNQLRATFTPAETQRFPGDLEAQGGQGAITLHSEEHLASSDKGVVLLRRVVRDQVKAVAEGRDAINTVFDPAAAVMITEAGSWITPAPALERVTAIGPARAAE